MHAIEFLKREHGKAKAAFVEIEGASSGQRGALWEKLRPELEQHEQMEETHLYGPVAREAQADESLRKWEATHQREVEDAEGLIREIGEFDPSDAKWLATVKKLRSALEEHIRKEEQEIWPKIMRVWDPTRLEEAGRQMAAPKHGAAAR
jgi:iron-sulfur cluster repair protein YtfE (RIC family)